MDRKIDRPIDATIPTIARPLLEEQNDRWDRGERAVIEELIATLERSSPPAKDRDRVLILLIVNEWLLRREAGETPDIAEYQARFPHLADQIVGQIRQHAAFDHLNGAEDGVGPSSPAGDVDATLGLPTPKIPGYQIIDRLGFGGMGVVYLAVQESLKRRVAIKLLLSGQTARPGRIQRFLNEGQVLARLNHPNIVRVLDVGMTQGLPFIVMEYVDGPNLMEHAGGRPLPAPEAVRSVELLARAVEYCHQQGVLHRDLKPSNVLLTREGVPKLTDFGLAKALETGSSSELTRTGELIGTPNYMSPEQASGGTVGEATDVYGLGTILYQLLTGRPPFEGQSTLEVIRQVMQTPPSSPRRFRPQLSRDLETICLKCLEKQPAARYASAGELADDLRRFQAGEPIRARRVGWFVRGWRWCRRHRQAAAIFTVITLILATATAVSLNFADRARRHALSARVNAAVAQRERDEAVEARWRSLLNEVAGRRHDRRPGRREQSLRILREALTMAREHRPLSDPDRVRFVSEAASVHGLIDLTLVDSWEGWPEKTFALRFHDDLTRYARLSDKPFEIRHAPSGEVQVRFQRWQPENVLFSTADQGAFLFFRSAAGASQIDIARVFPDADNPRRWTVKWRRKNAGSVVFRPDGRFAVCLLNLSDRGEVMVLLDGSSGEIRCELPPLLPLGERAFHPAKPQYVSARTQDDRHFLVLVDTDSAAVLREQAIPFEPAVAAWHPDGKQLAVAGMDRLIRLLDDRLQVTVTIPERLSSSGIQLAYSPEGDFLVSYDWSRELRIFDGLCGDLLLTTSMALADHRLIISPDLILTPEVDGKALRRYRLANRSCRPLALSPHLLDAFCKAVWSRDRHLLVTSHGPNHQTCLIHDARRGTVVAELPPFHVPLWFEADDSALITAVDHDHQTQQSVVYRWPVDRKNGILGPPERLLHQDRIGHPAAAAASPIVCFGPIVYRRGMKDRPVILDTSKQGWPDIRHASLSPDGRWAVLSSHGQGNSCLYDLETMAWTAELLSEPGHSLFSPDGSLAAVFGERSGRLYRTADWQVIGELPGSTGAFSPDGRLLAVSGATRGLPVGTVELIDTTTAHTICRFEHPGGGRVDPLGFGPDPAQLYLRVWRTRTIDVWDLREARRQLRADLDLDWDWPELPTGSEPPGEFRSWTVKTEATGAGRSAVMPGAVPETAPTNWRRWVESMLQKLSDSRRKDP